MPIWGWIALLGGAGALVAGAALASSGGTSTPAKPTTPTPTPSSTPSAMNSTGSTIVTNQWMILTAENALAGMNFGFPVGGAMPTGSTSDPGFTTALAGYQKATNAAGGYTPPGGKNVQLRTDGQLDFSTFAALMTAASTGNAPKPVA